MLIDPMPPIPSGGEMDGFGPMLAVMGLIMLLAAAVSLAAYIVSAIFLMRALKAAGHASPVSAWVPLWNTASLFELGGIRNPWAWIGILFGASFLGGLIPYVGFLVGIAATVLAVVLTIWTAKGVQEASGLDSVGGIVLAVLLPIVWLIWMGIRLPKSGYSPARAAAVGSTFPLKWFASSGRPTTAAFPGNQS